MKSQALSILIFFLIQLCILDSFAQEKVEEKVSYKNNITLNIGRFFLNEARFGYEKSLSDRNKLRVVLGLQYPTSSSSFHSVPIGLGYAPNYYKVSKGVYFGLGYNYTLGVKSRIYVSAEAYFNYNYYDKKYYHYCVGTDMDSYVSLQSMRLNKTGLKVLFGKKARIITGNKIGMELDFFAGFGIQYRIEEITIFEKSNGSCSWDYSELYKKEPPEIKTYKNWYPTLHAGILIGMPFKTI